MKALPYRSFTRGRVLFTPRQLYKLILMLLGITISPQGTVTRCDILASELDSVQLERDLIALVKGINFGPEPGSPAVTTRVPFGYRNAPQVFMRLIDQILTDAGLRARASFNSVYIESVRFLTSTRNANSQRFASPRIRPQK